MSDNDLPMSDNDLPVGGDVPPVFMIETLYTHTCWLATTAVDGLMLCAQGKTETECALRVLRGINTFLSAPSRDADLS